MFKGFNGNKPFSSSSNVVLACEGFVMVHKKLESFDCFHCEMGVLKRQHEC